MLSRINQTTYVFPKTKKKIFDLKFRSFMYIYVYDLQNIKINLKEIGINTRIWIDSAQDRDYWRALVNAALNLRVP